MGGPGASSLFALFYENGPFILKNEHEVRMRNETWTTDHSVIYIDNPVGTGFSFTDGGYAQNQTKVGEDLHEALKQFFTLFPELQNNDFFITGESYAGKYVPAAAYTILNKNSDENLKINLKGIAIGNGLSDPENQLVYSDYLYQIGLVDSNGRKKIHDLEQLGKLYIQLGKWEKAFEIFDILLNGDLTEETTVFKNLTGFDNYYNFLYPLNPIDSSNLGKFLQRDQVREAIHTGNMTYNDGGTVEKNLSEDFMKSVAPWVSEILSNIRVLIFNGQLDIIVAYPLTVNYLQNLKFDGSNEYKTAERYKWYVGDDLAGYVKQAGNLTEVLVRNAGHMVPSDQPQWALEMITKFTRNIEFH
ncbi:Venom serine carboxypeptidase [Gonioctena quinquepunctata]|nr:Venom serine carboxypeptidase [Gonioctena quinquepunctata]